MFRMIDRFSLSLALVCTLTLAAAHDLMAVQTAGPRSGGGADAAVPPNGTPTIAEPYASTASAADEFDHHELTLSKEVRAELTKAIQIYASYAGVEPKSSKLWQALLTERRRFIPVEKIPDREACKKRLIYPNAPAGWTFPQWACTEGWRTWLITEYFNGSPHVPDRPGFAIPDKAVELVHEGLRGLNAEDSVIVNTVLGLRVALENYQRQSAGDFSHPLDEVEKKALFKLSQSALMTEKGYDGTEMEYRNFVKSFTILPFGAMVSNHLLEAGVRFPTRLGIGTRFLAGFEIKSFREKVQFDLDESSTYLMTNICEKALKCKVGAMVLIDGLIGYRGWSHDVLIEEGALIRDSVLDLWSRLHVSRGTTIERSRISRLDKVDIGESSKIQNFTFVAAPSMNYLTLRPRSAIQNVDIQKTQHINGNGYDRFEFSGTLGNESESLSFSVCQFVNRTFFKGPVTFSIQNDSDLKNRCY